MLSKRFEDQLKDFSEGECRKLEHLEKLFEFLDDIIPLNEDEEVPSKKANPRKRSGLFIDQSLALVDRPKPDGPPAQLAADQTRQQPALDAIRRLSARRRQSRSLSLTAECNLNVATDVEGWKHRTKTRMGMNPQRRLRELHAMFPSVLRTLKLCFSRSYTHRVHFRATKRKSLAEPDLEEVDDTDDEPTPSPVPTKKKS
jgi:hypothetical protein